VSYVDGHNKARSPRSAQANVQVLQNLDRIIVRRHTLRPTSRKGRACARYSTPVAERELPQQGPSPSSGKAL
jgi:hypothetical protein